MRILIAPQEFKGTLTAVEAANAIASAIRRVVGSAELDVAPLSDGGPGFVSALLDAARGEPRDCRVQDPLGRPINARWGTIAQGKIAVLEMAAASGLSLLGASERDPRQTTTFGTGELIRAALDANCARILLGIGGSATNDGGAGAAEALGMKFLSGDGKPLPRGGAALARLEEIDVTGRDSRLDLVELFIAADVNNPLLGPTGASNIYGPQKGATPEIVRELDRALARLAEVTRTLLRRDYSNVPGAGAAGGLAFGLMSFLGGQLKSGFELVSEALHLQERIDRTEVVITGEGRLDRQSSYGKGPGSIATLAKRKGKRTVIFAGRVDASFLPSDSPFDEVLEVSGHRVELELTSSAARALLEAAVESWTQKEIRQ